MGKAMKAKRGKATAGNVHPLIVQAAIPAVQMARRDYEIAAVPNPLGETVIRGEVRGHKAVRVRPAWREMATRGVFDRVRIEGYAQPAALILAALEWFDERLDAAGSGLVRCGLGAATGGGGGASAGGSIPVSLAAMEARSDVARVWALLAADPLAARAFAAVMVEGERFQETARRLCAGRYVRVSVERQRRVLAEQFARACAMLAADWGRTHTRQRAGIVAAEYGEAA